jgi:hypothetical protein
MSKNLFYVGGKMFKFFNSKVKLFTLMDIKLSQLAAMCVLIVLIKLIPEIISLPIWIYICGAIVFAVRPLYLVFIKKV